MVYIYFDINKFFTMNQSKESIHSFYINETSLKWLKHASNKLPDFLNHNLVDDARIIKKIDRQPQSFMKVVLLQLLKHCFEIEQLIESSFHLNKFIDLLEENTLDFIIDSKHGSLDLTSETLKALIIEFLEMISQSGRSIEKLLASYPIFEDIIIQFFANLLQSNSCLSQQKDELNEMRKLCQILLIDYAEYEECFQFTLTQNYLYTDDPQHLYLIYIDQSKAEGIRKNSGTQQTMLLNSKFYSSQQDSFGHHSQQNIKKQTIIFGNNDVIFDQTNNGKCFNGFSKIAPQLQTVDTEKSQLKNHTKIFGKQNRYQITESPSSKKSYNFFNDCKFVCSSSQFKHKQFQISKQFTDSKILGILSEPYRSKVKQVKDKARAQRQQVRDRYCQSQMNINNVSKPSHKKREAIRSFFQ